MSLAEMERLFGPADEDGVIRPPRRPSVFAEMMSASEDVASDGRTIVERPVCRQLHMMLPGHWSRCDGCTGDTTTEMLIDG